MVAKYPEYDGSSADRENRLIRRVPSPSDWDQIVDEVLQHQAILRNSLLSFVLPEYTSDFHFVITDKFRIADFWVIKTEVDGSERDRLLIAKNESELFSEISLNVPDKTIIRATQIDDDLDSFEKNDLLTISCRAEGNTSCILYIQTVGE